MSDARRQAGRSTGFSLRTSDSPGGALTADEHAQLAELLAKFPEAPSRTPPRPAVDRSGGSTTDSPAPSNPSVSPKASSNGVFGTLDNPLTKTNDYYTQLIVRAKTGAISYHESEDLVSFLVQCPVYDATIYLNQAEILIHDEAREAQRELPQVTLSKFHLDFCLPRGHKVPLNDMVQDVITITNQSKNKVKFDLAPASPSAAYHLDFEPSTGVLKKGQSMEIVVRLQAKTTIKLRNVIFISLGFEGQPVLLKQFLILNVDSATTQFGRMINEVDMVADGDTVVPKVLVTLKQHLVAAGGTHSEGLFRLAADDAETKRIRAQLDDGTFNGVADVNALANLIKIWLRELPDSLLSPLRRDVNVDSEEVCQKAFFELPQPNRDVLTWLLNSLADVATNERETKMSPKNLAIVIAPNLLRPEGSQASSDPLASLYLSQKAVHFLQSMLSLRMRHGPDVFLPPPPE